MPEIAAAAQLDQTLVSFLPSIARMTNHVFSQETTMSADHLSHDEMLSFVHGKLDTARANSASAHLQQCETCYEQYARMATEAMLSKLKDIEDQNQEWSCSDPFWGAPYPMAAVTPPRTENEIRDWEAEYKLRLPAELARALTTQNGGCVRETQIVILPLEEFQLLSDPKWDDTFRFHQIVTERDKLLYIGFEDQTPASILLSYADGSEPGVLYLWHDLGDEIREEADSFEALLKER